MALQTLTVGNEQTRILVIDNLVQDPDALIDMAASLAPFPAIAGNYYPGVRRVLTPDDGAVFAYVQSICRSLSPLIESAYGVGALELLEASFSMVTTQPMALTPAQSRPHVDAGEAGYFAILHYLSRKPGGGTGFYRQTRTGFETLLPERLAAYGVARERDERIFGAPAGYLAGSSDGYVEMVKVEAKYNRAAIYPGNLLHSGLLPDNFDFSDDPRLGRLTANFLLRVRS